jgi:very-short-patch-repair endonuclease
LEYIELGQPNENPPDKFDSQFEQDVTTVLREKGLNVWTQYPSANFFIDLVVSDGENSIAVECDGPYHDESQSQIIHDAERQKILERAGWQFIRIPYRLWQQRQDLMTEKIYTLLQQIK